MSSVTGISNHVTVCKSDADFKALVDLLSDMRGSNPARDIHSPYNSFRTTKNETERTILSRPSSDTSVMPVVYHSFEEEKSKLAKYMEASVDGNAASWPSALEEKRFKEKLVGVALLVMQGLITHETAQIMTTDPEAAKSGSVLTTWTAVIQSVLEGSMKRDFFSRALAATIEVVITSFGGIDRSNSTVRMATFRAWLSDRANLLWMFHSFRNSVDFKAMLHDGASNVPAPIISQPGSPPMSVQDLQFTILLAKGEYLMEIIFTTMIDHAIIPTKKHIMPSHFTKAYILYHTSATSSNALLEINSLLPIDKWATIGHQGQKSRVNRRDPAAELSDVAQPARIVTSFRPTGA